MIGRKACFILPCGAGESLERGRKEDMYEQTTIQETCRQLNTDIINGLSRHEAALRGERDGKNELKEAHVKTLPESFLEQLNDPLIYVLLAAAAVSFLLKEASDAIIILVVVFVNAVVGMVQEGKADAAATYMGTARLYAEANPGVVIANDFMFEVDKSTEGTRIGMPKDEPELEAAINEIIDEIIESGQFEEWMGRKAG